MKCASLIVDCRNDGPYLQIASNLGDKGSGLCLSLGMVLKLRPNRMVCPKKPRTAHFCGSFSLKNQSMEKNRDPCKPRSDLTVLRTVIKLLFTVPCFLLNLNLKKKLKKKKTKKKKKDKTKQKNKRKRNTTAGSTSCLHKHCHCHLQRNTACLYVSSSSFFKVHHATPSLQKLFSWANQALNSGFVLHR